MNRRAFLGSLAAALAGATLDPERLLWVPGQRMIFDIHRSEPLVPENVFVTPDWIAREVLRALTNNLTLAGEINRIYEAEFRASALKVRVR